MDFTTWTWAYTNDTGHPLVIDGVPLDPGARRVFTGVAADSATGALLFLDSYNSVAAQLPAGAMALVPDMEEALRQAHEQAAAYDEGEKRLIVAPDQPTAFDPAAKDGPLDHPEQPADLVDRTQPPPNTAAEIGTQPPPPPGELPPKNPPPGEKEQRAKDEDKAKATGADPVDLFTGEFFLEKVDFELPSVGFPFVFIRTYKSGRSFFGPLGYNWDHSYNRYLRRLTTGAIAVNTGRLQEDIYRDSGDGVLFDAPRGVFAKLEQQPSASQYEFVLTTTGGVTQSFATPAGWSAPERIPLVRIADANGNAQQLVYDNNDRLATVIDTVGRRIDLIYGSCGLLEALRPEVLQASGTKPLEIRYLHADDIEHLCAVVTLPTPDFPNGLVTHYEYDDTQPLGEQRSNITRVIDAKGQVVVENLYGTKPGDLSFNRVVRQYFMGGEYLFNYTNVRFIPPLDEHVNDAALQVELLEPERPLKVYTFNFRGNLLDERFRLCADGSYRVWGQAYRYNAQGLMTEFYHANGMAEFLTYDESNPDPLARGNVLRIDLKSQPNRLLTRNVAVFTYEPLFQRVKTITDEAGQTTTFVYDYENDPLVRNGNLEAIVYPDTVLPDGSAQTNARATLRSDQYGQVVEQISPEGRTTEFEYYLSGNGAGLIKKASAHDGATVISQSFEYDALGNVTKRIDPRGYDTISRYNLLGQLVEYQLPVVAGHRATFKFEYNEDRKVAREYVPRGSYTDTEIHGDWITHEYEYDVASRLVREIRNSNTIAPQTTNHIRDVNGNVVKARNAMGQEARFKYDDRDLVLVETLFATSGAPIVWRYSYDRLGNITRCVHPDSTEERCDYNENFTRLKSHTNQLGVRKEYFYGPGDDLIKATIADNVGTILRTTSYGYDKRRRLVSCDVNGITQQIFYDRDHCVVRARNHLGDALTFTNDGLGRTVAVEDPLGNVARWVVDGNGNVRESSIVFPASGSAYTVQMSQTREFDARNRPIKSSDRLGNNISQAYDDRNLRTEIIDAYGKRCKLFYDVNGLPVRSTVVVNSTETNLYHWRRDLIGRQVGFEDSDGHLTRYEYDDRNNLTRTLFPDGSVIERTFTVTNMVETERDPNGSLSTFHYDQDSRVRSLTIQTGPNVAPTPAIQYDYDSFGRLTKLTKGAHPIERRFDAFGRITEEKQGVERLRKVFDDAGNAATLIYSDGREDLQVFDRIGRLKQVVFNKQGAAGLLAPDFAEGTTLVEYTYEGALLSSRRLANKTITSYLYQGGQLSGYELRDAADVVLDREQYVHDGEKRRRLIQRAPLAGCNRILEYDALSRLTECYTGVPGVDLPALPDQPSIDALLSGIATANAANTERYTLTPSDKRQSWTDGGVDFTGTYDARLSLLNLQASTGRNIVYRYDANGNRIEDEKFTYTYDAFDNMVEVTDKATGAKVLEQVFDAEGRIVEVSRGGTRTRRIFDGLRAMETIGPQSRRQDVYGVGLDDLVVRSDAGTTLFGHPDDANSLQCVTDPSGRVVESFCYSAFGKPRVFDPVGQPVTAGSATVEPTFAGRPYVGEIELYEFRKRMYDPTLGAFLQPDVYNYVESPNRYLYCKHNPVSFTDPTGSIIPLLIAIGIVSAEGGLTALGTAVVSGAVIGGVTGIGVNAARQNVQIQAHEGRTEFSFTEMFVSGGVGIVAGAGFPLLLSVSPAVALVAGVGLILKGAAQAAVEIYNGNVYTAAFDIATTALLPFAGKRLGSIGSSAGEIAVINGAKVRQTLVPDLYSLQGSKSKILPGLESPTGQGAGRIWAMTEGSVYAHERPTVPRWQTMVDAKNDPVILKFVGENAEVFKSHETTGIFSLMKYTLGQKKSGFGDLTFERATVTGTEHAVRTRGGGIELAPVVEVHGVRLAQGSFAGQSASAAMSRLMGRRILLDQLFNVPIGVGLENLPEQITPKTSKSPEPSIVSPHAKQ